MTTGIDPGLDGGLAIITPDEVFAFPMPVLMGPRGKRDLDLDRIRQYVTGAGMAAIERAQVMPKQGIASSGRIMENYGRLCGLLVGLGLPFLEVHPKRWQKEFGITGGGSGGGTKASSVLVAQQLFPGVSLRATPRCSTPHHGMSDALLIAEFCRRSGAAPIHHVARMANATR